MIKTLAEKADCFLNWMALAEIFAASGNLEVQSFPSMLLSFCRPRILPKNVFATTSAYILEHAGMSAATTCMWCGMCYERRKAVTLRGHEHP